MTGHETTQRTTGVGNSWATGGRGWKSGEEFVVARMDGGWVDNIICRTVCQGKQSSVLHADGNDIPQLLKLPDGAGQGWRRNCAEEDLCL